MDVDALAKSDRPELLRRVNYTWFDFEQLDIWHAAEMLMQAVFLNKLSG